VGDALAARGASFFKEVASASGLPSEQVEGALAELSRLGVVTCDSFGGLRALLHPNRALVAIPRLRFARASAPVGMESAGRWSLLVRANATREREDAVAELQARVLLSRHGVVFRRVLVRETNLAPWRDLLQALRRLEARGEIRGGRFVAGFAGEQYALPEAVPALRAVRRREADHAMLVVSAADPLCLAGVITPGERFTARARTRVAYRDGIPVAIRERGEVRALVDLPPAELSAAFAALERRKLPPMVRAYLGRMR
jgi:ATP-dependent Lhr-like helicase